MDKVHVIVNPFSARGKTGLLWQDIREIVHHYFSEYKYIFTEKPSQATEIARDLLQRGFDLIIGVGGDGTLNEIANGFFCHTSQKIINENASLGIIPSGTGSDFIRFLKIPKDFRKSVALIKNSLARKIDVGRVTYSEGNEPHSRYFINIADFGLGAEVIRKMASVPAAKRNAFSYYRGLLSVIRSYKSKQVHITLDDQREIEGNYSIGAVANGRIFGGGMIIAPQAEPDDGYFDLVLVKEMSPAQIVLNSRRLYTGNIHLHPGVTIIRAKKISVRSNEPVFIEYDGELGHCLPADFQILEKQLKFRV